MITNNSQFSLYNDNDTIDYIMYTYCTGKNHNKLHKREKEIILFIEN